MPSIKVTLSGTIADVRLSHPSNVRFSDVTPSGITTDVSFKQLENALFPIDLMFSVISIEVSSKQPRKA